MAATIPVPRSGYIPLLGHSYTVDKVLPVLSFRAWASECGEIYKLWLLGLPVIFVNSVELCANLSDDQRFTKSITGSMAEVRTLIGDGLFTAESDEKNWGIAHRLLMPRLKALEIKEMFPDMLDIATQLVSKWERFGPECRLNPTADFTRLAFDTVALCSMSYRLNSFYREDSHPFVQAMHDFLAECSLRAKRSSFMHYFMPGTYTKRVEDMKLMSDLAFDILQKRYKNPTDKADLLNVMLSQKDPKTGEGLSDDSIVKNLLTLLIAGHETTAGLLSFCLFNLMSHPCAMQIARAEVDELLGSQQIQLGDLNKFKYLIAVIRETLRISPLIPFRQVEAKEDTTIGGGKYIIPKGQRVVIHLEQVHADTLYWGPDASEFKPERMMDGKFEKLPLGAWQPFGFGARVCVGRPFVMQESLIALSMILQRFDLRFSDADYKLQIMQTLTVKPRNFFIHAVPRTG